jgi:undecaprenyl-diphosphatase
VNYDWFRTVNDLTGNSTLDAVMKFSARYLIYAIFLVALALCVLRLRERLLRPVAWTVVALVLTFVAGLVESHVHREKRPFQTHHVHQLIAHSPGQSFPSDHATAGFGVALAVIVFLSLRWGVLTFLGACLLGFSRIYDGIHYPLDILGGLLAAVIGVGITALASRVLASRQPPPVAPPPAT